MRPFVFVALALAFAVACGASRQQWAVALDRDDAAEVDKLVSSEGSPDFLFAKDYQGKRLSPLMVAARDGRTVAVERLLAAGADPSFTDPDGWTALHHACKAAQPKTAKLLLAKGADAKRQTPDGRQCLHLSSRYLERPAAGEAAMVHVIADAGVDVRAYPPFPRPARNAGWSLFAAAVKMGREDVLSAYLDRGVPVDEPVEGGETALMRVVRYRNLELARFFIARGADVGAKNARGLGIAELAAASLGANPSAVEKRRAAAIADAVDASLPSTEARLAVLDRSIATDRAIGAQALEEREAREARKREARRAEREQSARRAADLINRRSSSSPPSAATANADDEKRDLPDICYEPRIKACRETTGKTCNDCFHEMLPKAPPKRAQVTCPIHAKPCGSECCGNGYVCCGSEGGAYECRELKLGCKGWGWSLKIGGSRD